MILRRIELEVPGPYKACNPSVAAADGGWVAIVRTVNYDLLADARIRVSTTPDTVNWWAEISDDLSHARLRPLPDERPVVGPHGLEDARLVRWQDEWWMLASALHHGPVVRNTMWWCPVHRPLAGTGLHAARREKNWMPAVAGGGLCAVYGVSPLRLIWLKTGETIAEHATDLAGWSGGSQVVDWRGKRLCLIHRRYPSKRTVYRHRWLELGPDWRVSRCSEDFSFEGAGIEFAAGLATRDGRLVASYGIDDRQAVIAEVDPTVVEAMLDGEYRSGASGGSTGRVLAAVAG